MTQHHLAHAPNSLPKTIAALGHEGLRLFFPLSAACLALWPLVWIMVQGLDLPLTRATPAGLWHLHEMAVGGFGAALIGFMTTALPEWSDTQAWRGRPLFRLALIWGIARVIGALGWDAAAPVAWLADMGWMTALILYVLRLSWQKRTDRFLAFLFWLVLLALCETTARAGMWLGHGDLASLGTYGAAFSFLGFLAIALGRVTVPVTNLVLDPSEKSSPFRPHPGRMSLAAGLVFAALVGEAAGFSDTIRGYLWLAAGAGFMDRVAEAFIGRAFWRSEILVLALSAALAGAGLMLFAASLIGADFDIRPGLHVAFMGGLGFGTLAVFSVAGLRHTGRSFPFPRHVSLAMALLLAAVICRAGPDLAVVTLPGGHLIASCLWATAWLVWLKGYWPFLSRPGASTC